MTSREVVLYGLIRQVRTCFNQLKMLAEVLHDDLGVNPSMRAVMESLAADGSQTVPDIARDKKVSRQHIQSIMNALVSEQLAVASDNPAHKRSPLFDLTAKGRATYKLIQAREGDPLRRLATGMSADALRDAEHTLADLNRLLTNEIAERKSHE